MKFVALMIIGLVGLAKRRGFAAGIVVAAFVFLSQPLCASEKALNPYVNAVGFGAVGSDMETMSNQAVGLGWIIRGGIRQQWLGLFFECQRDYWLETDKDVEMNKGVMNFGVGADILILHERLKMSLSMGTSTLMFDAIFDDAGTTGFYVDFQPTVFRWPLSSKLTLEFSPFGATLMIPALAEPVLKRLEYRTSLGLEWQF